MVSPSPFVYWAQDAKNIYLKVDLKDIKDEKVTLSQETLVMSAYGIGAHGPSNYAFTLNFYGDLEAYDEVHQTKSSPRAFMFTLKKAHNSFWPRLIKHQQKPAWLKIDFDRWTAVDCDDEEYSDSALEYGGGAKDIMGDYPELFQKLKLDEVGYISEDVKSVYLVFYNLMQFVLFMYIMFVMGIRFMKEGNDYMKGAYQAVGPVLKFAQILQWLEVMYPIFGYTPGGVLSPLMQVGGRSLVLFAMIEAEPRMQTKPVVSYLILVWSAIEVVRYPYYISQTYKKDIPLLTWLRYTIWIPLYPLGALCEGIIILRNIPYFEETQKFVVSMPNEWNTTFHTPTIMRIYLLVLFIPGVWSLMSHMYRARNKKLGSRKWKTKSH
ncbi:hypothetical protein GE061_001538 [Apolygus lucorum]|uniref:Very-long-chain (3R)-3-hydroxyacyl-CoA dehydratase n=1 Tax=Apolygus lucorum TaxID=248454 RepID=A0A6A4KJU9_APOLU|nr:hypothetical protein GE061_001538 [Apolygus lucorum]